MPVASLAAPGMLVILRMALRNLREHRSRTLIVGSIITAGVAVVVAGNSLADTASDNLRGAFVDNFTGHVMIHGETPRRLSLFGFGLEVTNVEIPRIGSYEEVFAHVTALPEVESTSPQLTMFAVANADEQQNEDFSVMIMGVEAESYGTTFPDALVIAEGGPLLPGQAGVMLPAGLAQEMGARLGEEPKPGDRLLLTAIVGGGGQIRELPITGIFRFRKQMLGLDQVLIVDARSFRSLAGLVVGTDVALTEQETEVLAVDDLDALFSDGEQVVDDAASDASAEESLGEEAVSEEAVSEEEVFAILDDRERAPLEVDAAAWNFLLLKLAGPRATEAQERRLVDDLNGYFRTHGIAAEAVGWRLASGGFARLASAVLGVFHGTVAVIAVVAVIIITNTLVISVMERTSEIGTMRALGASRRFVRRLFLLETLSTSWLFGAAGIVLGALVVAVLGGTGIPAGNDFMRVLFGGDVLAPALSAFSVGLAAAVATAIGLVASVYPVTMALRVQPVRAVQTE